MKGVQLVYGLHPVRALLLRQPARVRQLRIAERRDDPRARELEQLARQHGIAVVRVSAHSLQQALGEVAHQGVAAEVAPLPPWSEDDLLEALGRTSDPLLLALVLVRPPVRRASPGAGVVPARG